MRIFSQYYSAGSAGENLWFSEWLRNDKDVSSITVENNEWSLKSAPEELRNDKEVVKIAVRKYRRSYDLLQPARNDDFLMSKLWIKMGKEKSGLFPYISVKESADRSCETQRVSKRKLQRIKIFYTNEDL